MRNSAEYGYDPLLGNKKSVERSERLPKTTLEVMNSIQNLGVDDEITLGTNIGVEFTVTREKNRGWVIKQGIMSYAEGSSAETITVREGRLLIHGEDKGLVTTVDGESLVERLK